MIVHVYTPGAGQAHTSDVEETVRLREVIGAVGTNGAYRVDDEVEIDVELTVAEVFGTGPGHIVVHPCRKVAVTVAYAGSEKVIHAHPATRLRTVRTRAIEVFGIPGADAVDLVLRLPSTTADLNLAEPVGVLVPAGTCDLTLDLVHARRPQG